MKAHSLQVLPHSFHSVRVMGGFHCNGNAMERPKSYFCWQGRAKLSTFTGSGAALQEQTAGKTQGYDSYPSIAAEVEQPTAALYANRSVRHRHFGSTNHCICGTGRPTSAITKLQWPRLS